MVHVPAPTRDARLPATVQTELVDELKLTGNPELAVAFKVSDPPATCPAIAPKVMVWAACVTLNVCVTGAAAAYFTPSPGCAAVIEQPPVATKLAIAFVTVQTVGVEEVKVTGSPALSAATSASGVPTV